MLLRKDTVGVGPAGPERFAATHWTIVLQACQRNTPEAERALAKLCETYRYPLYACVRRQGYGQDEAEDLTQGFFAQLLAKNYLKGVHPQKGKFRSFLISALKHFVANEWHRQRAAKRGGKITFVSLDDSVETRYIHEPADPVTPESIYDRAWAQALLDKVIKQLQSECVSAEKSYLFDELQRHLTEDPGAGTYREAAAKLGMTEAALKMTMLRLRRRFGEILRAEVAKTVSSPEEVEEEIRYLCATFSS